MKNVARLLAFLLLLQSCNVYHAPTTVGEAVIAEKKTRVISRNNKKYDFIRLEMNNDRLTGITKRSSSTARKLLGMPAEIDGKYLKYDLSNFYIESISLRNDSRSSKLTAATVIGSLAAFIGALLIFADHLDHYDFGKDCC